MNKDIDKKTICYLFSLMRMGHALSLHKIQIVQMNKNHDNHSSDNRDRALIRIIKKESTKEWNHYVIHNE